MRMIDADAFYEHIESYARMFTDELGFVVRLQAVLDGVAYAPTIEAEPVKHGRWIEGFPTETTDYFNCSVCNAGIFVNNLWRVSYEDVSEIHRFCRNCGAKMDGDKDAID